VDCRTGGEILTVAGRALVESRLRQYRDRRLTILMPARRHPFPGCMIALAVLLLAGAVAGQQGPAAPPVLPAPEATQDHLSRRQADELFRSVDEILRFVSADTGLPVQHSVKKRLVARAYVQQYVERRMAKDKDAQRLQRSELVLKKFGLLPRTFDLRSFLVAVLREQVAGFYDPKSKTVNLLDWIEPEAQRPVLAHELTHALQDQDHRVDDWIRHGPKRKAAGAEDDEQVAARQASIEGQAMVVLVDFELLPQHQTILEAPNIVEAMKAGMSLGSPLFSQAPIYLKEALAFPYTYGLDFEREVLSKKGKDAAFRGVLNDPPISTRQVMQPETYLAGERLAPMLQPAYGRLLGRKFERVDEGQIGELDVSILLKQFTDEEAARRLWTQWRGGYYYASRPRNDPGAPVSLLYVSQWATPEGANQFAAIYGSSLPKKYARLKAVKPAERDSAAVVSDTPGEVKVTIADPVTQWDTNEGRVFVEAHGNDVLVMEGFDQLTAAKVRAVSTRTAQSGAAAAR
jgi:hypothetical protein